ncbi:MAG: hypothetical protein ACRENC_10360, partial [Gemmatimonadaceae bacterium]
TGAPRWCFRRAPGAPARSAGEELGEDRVDGPLNVRLYRHDGGFRLVYDDSGTFDVNAAGTHIDWFEAPGAVMEAVQLDVLGRVLPTAMYAAGALCLHGSAVQLNTGAVAFLAPKGHGKSTLAHALVGAGARLVSDDVVPIDLDAAPRMRPGVAHVRLLRDAARHLRVGDGHRTGAGGKLVIEPGELFDAATEPLPVAALYRLQPMRAEGAEQAAFRTRLTGVAAAMAVLAQVRLARLLGGVEAPALLDRASCLAERVPVFTLNVARDFQRLPEVVAQVLDWHSGVPARREVVAT